MSGLPPKFYTEDTSEEEDIELHTKLTNELQSYNDQQARLTNQVHSYNFPRVPSPLLEDHASPSNSHNANVNFNLNSNTLNVFHANPTTTNMYSRPRSRSTSVKKVRSRNLEAFDVDEMRPRTSSLPTRSTYRKPDLASLHLHPHATFLEHEADIYRIRNFELTSKGIINRGDSLRSRSTNSVISSGSEHGALSRTSSSLSQESFYGNSNGSGGSGHMVYRVLVTGSYGVGKTCLIKQFTTSEYLGGFDTSVETEDEKVVAVLLDGEETTIEFVDMGLDTISSFKEGIDVYMIIYSIDDRATFDRAVDTLFELRKEDQKDDVIIMVGNKCDLVRTRVISAEEGKSVATTYNAKFVETSMVLNLNIDELLAGTVSQIRLKIKHSGKHRRRLESLSGCMIKSKTLMNKIFRKENLSKSSSNLFVL